MQPPGGANNPRQLDRGLGAKCAGVAVVGRIIAEKEDGGEEKSLTRKIFGSDKFRFQTSGS
jgi:hypothetical protein